MASTQKIVPFLWFNDNAEEAIAFYSSVFKENAKMENISRTPEGKFLCAHFFLNGQEFMALNGGPIYSFTPAISFFVGCQTQEEIDYYWDKFADGGKPLNCGWINDKFGVCWQIVPTELGTLMNDKDPEKAKRVGEAMRKMIKLDINALKRAKEGEPSL